MPKVVYDQLQARNTDFMMTVGKRAHYGVDPWEYHSSHRGDWWYRIITVIWWFISYLFLSSGILWKVMSDLCPLCELKMSELLYVNKIMTSYSAIDASLTHGKRLKLQQNYEKFLRLGEKLLKLSFEHVAKFSEQDESSEETLWNDPVRNSG